VESPSSAADPTRVRRPGKGVRIAIALTVTAVAVALTPAVPGQAQAQPGGANEDTNARLARLEKRAKALAKEYRGEIVNLTDARRAAQRANKKAGLLKRDLSAARARVAHMAARSYMSGGIDKLQLTINSDPQSMIDSMAVANYLERQNGSRVASLERLAKEAGTAERTARIKVAEVDKLVNDLEKQRTRVKNLLKKFRPEKARKSSSSGGSASAGGLDLRAKSPLTGNVMTSRMRRFYLEVDTRFGPFPSIGCHRPGDPQDHGTGRACDFMESFGVMPSAARAAHGDRVAQFAIDNASRLGLKYVIWKQRIYDVRNPGWRPMEDRGSITQNHFDHVHISVF
jgi:hypothetical protein